jgi:hypothetical protein
MTKSGPSQNPSLFNAFYDFEAPQKNETQPGAEAAFAAACAIGAFIGLHGQRTHLEKLGYGLGPDLTIIGILT